MKSLNAHLTLPGSAREAVARYREILGGELAVVPQDPSSAVFHAELTGERFQLMLADGEAPRLGLHVACEDRAELERLFNELSVEGTRRCGIETAFDRLYAEVVDRFGVLWYLTLSDI